MGNLLGLMSPQADLRPMLRVRVIRLVQASYNDSNQELDAYVQLTYGDINENEKKLVCKKTKCSHFKSDPSNNRHHRGSLAAGADDTETKTTNVKETEDQARYFDETFYFPVPTISAKYSLEISVWDRDDIPLQATDDYIGKAIIYYHDYINEDSYKNMSDQEKTSSASDKMYFLPNEFNKIVGLAIEVSDQTGAFATGLLEVEVEFQHRQHYHLASDGVDENIGMDGTGAGGEHERYEKPSSVTCSWFR